MTKLNISQLLRPLKNKRSLDWLDILIKEEPSIEIYLVGGSVRDLLIGRAITDYDFVFRKISLVNLSKLLKRHGRVIFTGQRFGVYKFTPKGYQSTYDIALPRLEKSKSLTGQHRDFKINYDENLSLTEDLKRRDFTINAMAIDWSKEILIDPNNGLVDLAREIIRTVGMPNDRFAEDYIRMLRAIRFACELDYEIDNKTWTAIKRWANKLKQPNLPREPMAKEINIALLARPLLAIDYLNNSGILQAIAPNALKRNKSGQNIARQTVEFLLQPSLNKMYGAEDASITLIVAAWLSSLDHRISKSLIANKTNSAVIISRQLKLTSAYPSVDIKKLSWLIRNHIRIINGELLKEPATSLELTLANPLDPNNELLRLSQAVAKVYQTGQPAWLKNVTATNRRWQKIRPGKKMPTPLLRGDDLIKNGLASGPIIGQMLLTIREAQLLHKIKNKKEALIMLNRLINKK
ncbi:MAG: hypothetical protein V1838_03465 [Patescibacteria group bacterium]